MLTIFDVDSLGSNEAKQVLILGALGSLDALVDTVPQFISPYTVSLLEQALHPALQEGSPDSDGIGRRVSKTVFL